MFEKFEEYKKEYKELEKKLTLPEVINNQNKLKKYARRHGELKEILEEYDRYLKLKEELKQAQKLYEQESGEMQSLASEEIKTLKKKIKSLEKKLKFYLLPRDPDADKDVIMEIRAGTGGDEAALFCAKLYRMYVKFAESKGWKTEVYSSNRTGLGGFKEIIFSVEGSNVFGYVKSESGVHRVQRVPETETGGRIHTSACSVVVLPQADEIEFSINKDDLRVDTYRASGKGGQHVNVTDSAVRITHIPTGVVAQCQDERSQSKNKVKAMNMLRARIKEKIARERAAKKDKKRRKHIGSGDRSQKIRTYNFPQNRITDHRVNLKVYNLDEIIDGALGDFLEELKKKLREQELSEL